MNRNDYPFKEPQNIAVITEKAILEASDIIAHVVHDNDGDWQFLTYESDAHEHDARVVGLGTIWKIDPTISELADLPTGWCAWRRTKAEMWTRAKDL